MRRVGAEGDPLVRVAQGERFGDYQSNCAMGLAKKLRRKPRELAEAIVAHLNVEDICERPEIEGPGFINFRLKPAFLARALQCIPPCDDPASDRLGIERTGRPQIVVVDLSSPNLAKEMHVGHLRSTLIGDCVSRVLEFEGHTVHRENHIGDWGTQFGMLIAHLRSVKPEVVNQPDELMIGDLEAFYIEAKARFDIDEEFKRQSREAVVALQGGDPVIRRIWRAFCDESLRHCHAIYDRLGVRLVDRGESFYTDFMDEVVGRLEPAIGGKAERRDGLVRVSEGALCLFMEGFKTRAGEPLPLIVRKSDGGYNYATSDLATIIHRVEQLGAKRIIYVVGLAQKQHFDMLFAAARQVGWVDETVSLEHLGFGNMLAPDGRPFKTREGGTVKLKGLLDEAVARARKVIEEAAVDETRPQRAFSKEQVDEIAEKIGLAAVKYFDLSHSLTTDYRFELDTMVNMEGNTAPYMLYAYARIRSIERKAGVDFRSLRAEGAIIPEHPAEGGLAKKLLQLAETLEAVGEELRPNLLTDYLHDLAKAFTRFYDRKFGVRVIDASPDSVRISRLRLCDVTARALRLGLRLLGVETVEQM
jgi:arginyl-tRNA synthetase